MYLGKLAEMLPARVLTALHADVEDYKWLIKSPVGHHPFREQRVGVIVEVNHGSLSRRLVNSILR